MDLAQHTKQTPFLQIPFVHSPWIHSGSAALAIPLLQDVLYRRNHVKGEVLKQRLNSEVPQQALKLFLRKPIIIHYSSLS